MNNWKCLCWIPEIPSPRDGAVYITDCSYIQATPCGTSCQWYCDPQTFTWILQRPCQEGCECDPPPHDCTCDNICETFFSTCFGYVTTTTTTSTTTTTQEPPDCGQCTWYCGCKEVDGVITWYWLQTKACAFPDACDCPLPEEECTVEKACETRKLDCTLSDEWYLISEPTGPCGVCKYRKVDLYSYTIEAYGCILTCDCPTGFSNIRIRNPVFWIVCDPGGGLWKFTFDQTYRVDDPFIVYSYDIFAFFPSLEQDYHITAGTFVVNEFSASIQQDYVISGGRFPEPGILDFTGSVTETEVIEDHEFESVFLTLDFSFDAYYDPVPTVEFIVPDPIEIDTYVDETYILDGGEFSIYDPCATGVCLYVWYNDTWYLVENLCPCSCYPPTVAGQYNGELKRGICKIIPPSRIREGVIQEYVLDSGSVEIWELSGVLETEQTYEIIGGTFTLEEPERCVGWCIYIWNGQEWLEASNFCSCNCYPPETSGNYYGEIRYGTCS